MDIYNKLCDVVSGQYIDPKIEEDSEFEIEDQYLSSDKINKELGIKADIGIDEGLSRTIQWYKQNIELIKEN